MNSSLTGIMWAFVAVIGWGFGDYLIQKVSREMGIWKTLFFISAIGSLGLLPFVWDSLSLLLSVESLFWVITAGIAMTIGSIFIFESFKEGKLAIMEPIISTELPIAVLLAVTLRGESLNFFHWLLILVIFMGIVFTVTEHRSHLHYHKRWVEKGVVFAAMGALTNGLIDVLMGSSGQEVSPLLTVWSVWVITLAITLVYLYAKGYLRQLSADFKKYPSQLIVLGILDTGAWVGFVMAAVYIPIAVTAAITESYIIIAILLGLLVNREKLRSHQAIGIIITAIAVMTLAIMVG